MKKNGIIYKVTSPSGKVYIGKTINSLRVRRNNHLSEAKRYRRNSKNRKFHNALLKYGDLLTWEVLEIASVGRLKEREIFYIEMFNSYENGYNSTLGGDGSGHIISDETRKKMSLSKKGCVPWNKGVCWSEEVKERMSFSQKRRYQNDLKNHPWHGRKHSEKTKEKMKEAWKYRSITKQQLENLKIGQKKCSTFVVECPNGNKEEIKGRKNLEKFMQDEKGSFSSLLKYGHSKGFRLLRRGY